MDHLKLTKSLLEKLNMPLKQQGKLSCLVLLALAKIKNTMSWKRATNEWLRIHDIMVFIQENYGVKYAENSRETIRKQVMHPFRTAALIEDNGKATNSPNYCYRLTPEFLSVIKSIRNKEVSDCLCTSQLKKFIDNHDSLTNIYASKKKMQMMPVKINNQNFKFSNGKHNLLQKAIIEEFAPRFAPNSECLYVGDTIKKDLVKNVKKLKELGFEITKHDKMPDVVLYRKEKHWIYFIESVTSVGPMDPKRILELDSMTKKVKAGKIYVTAFLDFSTFKKFSEQLAWETEVWISDMPNHMIHLNGDKFLGPR